MKQFKIGNREIGGQNPVFIIAEIGINFDGKFEQALQLIDVAADAGCDAVKYQLFKAEKMYTTNAGEYEAATGEKIDIIKVVKDAELPIEWVVKLREHAQRRGVEFFSTVCDEQSADKLEKEGTSAYKMASYAITHLPLMRHVAKKQMPVIFSSGGATLKEVCEALEVLEEEGNDKIVLNHCIGKYPTPLDAVNMRILTTFINAFPNVVIGYSDHTSDPIVAPVAAVALGAKVIEKHITLDRNLPGPDHTFALEPHELKTMVDVIRETEQKLANGEHIDIDPGLLGTSERKTFDAERKVRKFAYRSLFATKPITKEELFSPDNIAVLRPGEKAPGIEPKWYDLLCNRVRAKKNIKEGEAITWSSFLDRTHKDKKVGIVIQARMGSTRLPGKVLKKIGDKTLLEILLRRLEKCQLADEIIVATSTNQKDDELAAFVTSLGFICVRGDEDDVLSRYVKATRQRDLDVVVRICSDNPLTCPEFVDKLTRVFIEGNFDYVYSSSAPDGIKMEVTSREALLHVNSVKDNPYREHVTYYLLQHPEIYPIKDVEFGIKKHDVRLTVDTPDDFALIEKLAKQFGSLLDVDIQAVITYIEQNQEIKSINNQISQINPSKQEQ